MKLLNYKKLMNAFIATASAFVFLVNPLVQADELENCVSKNAYAYLGHNPWLSLIMDDVTYGPITISNVHINQGSKLAIVQPGEVIEGKLHYSIDTSSQEMLERYHLVVGLKGIGAQDCVCHNYSIWNSKNGSSKFTLKAPLEPGLYEVHFSYQDAATCEEARSVWNSESGEPSAYTLIGAIIVE